MPRRGENIYKRKDGRWEGRYKPDGSSQNTNMYMRQLIKKQRKSWLNLKLISLPIITKRYCYQSYVTVGLNLNAGI